MRRVAIVQARLGSSRFPGKVLADLGGRPILAHVVERLRRCAMLDGIVIATTSLPEDDRIAAVAEDAGVACVRGSAADVLSRYVAAAAEARADVVVRITADCPLLQPEVVDSVVSALVADGGEFDYASNVIERRFPRGLDAESLFADTLERVARLATSVAAREHVTWFILRERPELFLRHSVIDEEDNSDLRWTLDTPRDLELIRALHEAIVDGHVADHYRSLAAHVRADARLAQLAVDPAGA